MGDFYLIEGVRRDATGEVTHVGWCQKKPYMVSTKADVSEVIAALRGGAHVNVEVGFIIGNGVQVSDDGRTIIDQAGEPSKPFRLADVPLI